MPTCFSQFPRWPARVGALLAACALQACATQGYREAAKSEDHAVLTLQQEKGPLGLFGGTQVVVDRINGEEAGSLWSAGAAIRVRPGPLELVAGAIEDNHYGVCLLAFAAKSGATYDLVADRADTDQIEKYRLTLAERGGPTVATCEAARDERPFTRMPAILKGAAG